MDRRARERQALGLGVSLNPWADHADLMLARDLAPDFDVGMLRYQPVAETSECVKTKWFHWREHGRLREVLRSCLGGADEIVGADGYALIEGALNLLDEEFKRLLGNRSAVAIWTCLRNVSPCYWIAPGWQIQNQVRRVAENAVVRHARWDSIEVPLPTSWSASDMQAAGRCLATAEAYNNLLAARR